MRFPWSERSKLTILVLHAIFQVGVRVTVSVRRRRGCIIPSLRIQHSIADEGRNAAYTNRTSS